MELSAETFSDAILIKVKENRIDSASAVAFKDRMRELTSDGPDRVIIDLAQVDFVDSSGLGAIVAAMKQIGSSRKMELAALTENVEKVFHLTRMDTVFTIHANAADAVIDVRRAS